MFRQIATKRPFTLYYVIAVAFPTILFSYLLGLEILFQNLNGPDFSFLGTFYAHQGRLIEDHPILFQHRDTILLYLAGYMAIPLGAPFLFFPLAPTVSALFVSWLRGGFASVRKLLSHYRPVRGTLTARDGLRIYALVMICMLALSGVLFVWSSLTGNTKLTDNMYQTFGLFDWRNFAMGALLALFLNQGGLLEELGWRGFALPYLLRRYTPLIATLIVGVCWTFWHFPREIPSLISGQQSIPSLLLGQLQFMGACVGLSIVITYFVNISGGSVLPAIMWHGLFNYVYTAMSVRIEGNARVGFNFDAPVLWLSCAALVLLLVGPDLGYKRRREILGEAE